MLSKIKYSTTFLDKKKIYQKREVSIPDKFKISFKNFQTDTVFCHDYESNKIDNFNNAHMLSKHKY